MASIEARTAIRAYIEANWPEPSIERIYENEVLQTPDLVPCWIYIEIFGREYLQTSIGSGDPSKERWMEDGTVHAHVMVPIKTGAVEASRVATLFVRLLRGVKLPNNTEFGDAAIGAGDPGDERGKYWRLSATMDWERRDD